MIVPKGANGAVYVIGHELCVELPGKGDSMQEPGGAKLALPEIPSDHDTPPVRIPSETQHTGGGLISVTVTVYVIVLPARTVDGFGVIITFVARLFTVMVVEPELGACALSPG